MFNDKIDRDDLRPLRTLVDSLPSMLAYWDRDLRCRFANRAYQRWFGVDAERLIGTHLRDLLGPALFALNEPFIRGALAGEVQQFERIVPGPDGVQRHSLALYQPNVVDGRVSGFLVQVTDVSVLKQTEAALRAEVAAREQANAQLRAAHRRLAEAQRLGRIGSWEWDVQTDQTRWSEALYGLFGLDPSQPPPTLDEHPQRYAADSWHRLRSAVAVALSNGEPYVLELEFRRADGTPGWCEARGEVVRDDAGRIAMLRGTVMDVTEQRAARDLRAQRDLAEQASRDKSVFLSRVSHELRTPLNGILGAAQIIARQEGPDSRPGRWAAIIDRSGRNMATLVDALLDLSAAELGHLQVAESVVDVAEIARASLAAHADAATAAQVALQDGLPHGTAAIVLGDPARLRQVLDHLVSNAVKYNRAGGQVRVAARVDGSALELQVEDTGTGLGDAQLAQLFTPFNRLGAERTVVPGTGVGLALTQRLVELMGGTIRVESRPGQGTCFTVRLRAAPA